MKNFKKILRPGTVEVWKRQGKGYAPMFVKIEYTDGHLSITGVEGPTADGNAWGSCGQCTDALTRLKDLAPEWNRAMVKRLRETWDAWHLNDMRAGCEHQRKAGWDKRPIDPSKPLDAYGDHIGKGRSTWNMLAWVTPEEHPDGLLGYPCAICHYKYGTKWLREEVPDGVVAFLRGLPESKGKPAWV